MVFILITWFWIELFLQEISSNSSGEREGRIQLSSLCLTHPVLFFYFMLKMDMPSFKTTPKILPSPSKYFSCRPVGRNILSYLKSYSLYWLISLCSPMLRKHWLCRAFRPLGVVTNTKHQIQTGTSVNAVPPHPPGTAGTP